MHSSSLHPTKRTARFVPNTFDSILITFPDAKLSVIDFDPSRRNITTRALFNFDALHRRIGNVTSCHTLTLRVDPLQRCAALLVAQDLLFILPLFARYLEKHRLSKQAQPIKVESNDSLAQEHRKEVELEELIRNPNANRNQRDPRNPMNARRSYKSPLPPPPHKMPKVPADTVPDGIDEENQEDLEYLDGMRGDANPSMFSSHFCTL